MRLGLATIFRPRTKGWGKARAAIHAYVEEVETTNRKALGISAEGAER
jgi:heterodisulfide reductase subunit C